MPLGARPGAQSSECCVYPDSALKFHLAYDPRNHQSNYAASQQLFNSYPQSMRERLGGPTRQYEVLRRGELIVPGSALQPSALVH
jgi:hypothetical protein